MFYFPSFFVYDDSDIFFGFWENSTEQTTTINKFGAF